jgi:hypothetical protein
MGRHVITLGEGLALWPAEEYNMWLCHLVQSGLGISKRSSEHIEPNGGKTSQPWDHVATAVKEIQVDTKMFLVNLHC